MLLPAEDAAAPDLVQQVGGIFSETGLFSQARNFEYRPQQQAMAMAVARALTRREHLVVEAGTGVGKSFAYLVPAILFAVAQKRKAVISTHTINLQEQLTEKDLPLLQKVLPVEFQFAMLKGRQNYLCTRRLEKALQQAVSLFTSPETSELRRIQEWAATTTDGSLSDFPEEPDPKVWEHVCSERGLCTPKKCGYASERVRSGNVCFFQRARQRILGADVLVLNHTLFFTLLGGVEEELPEGVLFRNDFVIFDEAHTVEQVAARHIGVSVSSGGVRYALQRLWNPRTEKGLLATLRVGEPVRAVAEVLEQTDDFFERIEDSCEQLARTARPDRPGAIPESSAGALPGRAWRELRIRRPDLVEDTVTLSLQRLRERLMELVQSADDRESAEELQEALRRLSELRTAVQTFLRQDAEDHVYWVERSGRSQRVLSLNAAPVDVAVYLRERLFGANTSVVMTSATLGIHGGETAAGQPAEGLAGASPALRYFARRVGGEAARGFRWDPRSITSDRCAFSWPAKCRIRVIPDMRMPWSTGSSTSSAARQARPLCCSPTPV